RRPQRRRDRAVPGRALRRVRALPSAGGIQDLAAVVRAAAAGACRWPGGVARGAPACGARAAARRRRAGVVMGQSTLVFALLAAVLAVAVLAFVLRPLWHGPGSRIALGGLFAGLLLAAFALYRLAVAPLAPAPAVREPPLPTAAATAQLEAELEREPQAIQGWRLLGRAYAAAGQPDKARDAFGQAARLAPDEPDVLVEAAEARALAAPEHRFDAAGTGLLEHALEVDATHQRARWFLGIARRQAGDAAGAARTWEPLLAQVDARTAAPLREQVDAARADAGLPPLPPMEPASREVALQVRVSLAPAL